MNQNFRYNSVQVRDILKLINEFEMSKGTVEEVGLNVSPPYQREFVATSQIEKGIVSAVLKGKLIAPVVFRVNPANPGLKEVLDGKQRIMSISRYINMLTDSNDGDAKLKKTEFLNKWIHIVDVGEMTNDEAYSYFIQCNKSSTKMSKPEMLRIYAETPIYKEISQFKDWYKTNIGISVRDKDIEYLVRIISTIYLKKWTESRTALDYIKEQIETLQEKDELMLFSFKLKKHLLEFTSVFKKLSQELKARSLEMTVINLTIISAVLVISEKITSNEIGQFCQKYLSLFSTEERLNEYLISNYNIPLKHLGTGNGQRYIFNAVKNLVNNIKIDTRRFSKDVLTKKEEPNASCIECGALNSLEDDHIIPFSKGGLSISENHQLLCSTCNKIKNNKVNR